MSNETEINAVCGDSDGKQLVTLEDYFQERHILSKKIVGLEIQIDILEKSAQQYCGSTSSADVLGLPGIHAEVKRTETLSLYAAYTQAVRDAEGSMDMPTVFHRRSEKPWLVVMSLEDWAVLYRKYKNF